jgi:hypothetical protein
MQPVRQAPTVSSTTGTHGRTLCCDYLGGSVRRCLQHNATRTCAVTLMVLWLKGMGGWWDGTHMSEIQRRQVQAMCLGCGQSQQPEQAAALQVPHSVITGGRNWLRGAAVELCCCRGCSLRDEPANCMEEDAWSLRKCSETALSL